MAVDVTDAINSAKKPWEMPGSQMDAVAALKAQGQTAAAEVANPYLPGLNLGKIAGGTGAEQSMITALNQSYESQRQATATSAKKAGGALQTMGGTTEQYIKNIETMQQAIPQLHENSVAAWNTATEKADEYVQASRARVAEALSKIDEINEKISQGRDFAMAHDLQSGVQGVVGQMNAEERRIAETYGTNSAEYQQFTTSRKASLAAIHSSVVASYQKLRETQTALWLSASNETQWKHNMYVSYQEQQHVETLRYMAQMQSEFDLNLTQFQVQAEGLKMAGMENYANWIVQTPPFAMDATPFVAAWLNIQATADARNMANRQMALAEKEAAKKPTYFQAPIQWLPGGSVGTWGMA